MYTYFGIDCVESGAHNHQQHRELSCIPIAGRMRKSGDGQVASFAHACCDLYTTQLSVLLVVVVCSALDVMEEESKELGEHIVSRWGVSCVEVVDSLRAELLERVFLRVGVAESDSQLEAALARFLPAVLVKTASPSSVVQAKVLVCQSRNIRI